MRAVVVVVVGSYKDQRPFTSTPPCQCRVQGIVLEVSSKSPEALSRWILARERRVGLCLGTNLTWVRLVLGDEKRGREKERKKSGLRVLDWVGLRRPAVA